MTDQTIAGQEILISARERAVEQGISIIPYLMALYIEYMDLREEAVDKCGEKAIQSLENEFARTLATRMFIRQEKKKHDIMYA